MHSRAARLIADLDLVAHPEGGYFREVFRSSRTVNPDDGRPSRPALTTIYFLLAEGDVSRWHRVRSDEAWHFLEGDSLELLETDSSFEEVSVHRLGHVDQAQAPIHVVPAGRWQAARPTGAYALVACTVGPGFDFEDFDLLRDVLEDAQSMRDRLPSFASLI